MVLRVHDVQTTIGVEGAHCFDIGVIELFLKTAVWSRMGAYGKSCDILAAVRWRNSGIIRVELSYFEFSPHLARDFV